MEIKNKGCFYAVLSCILFWAVIITGGCYWFA